MYSEGLTGFLRDFNQTRISSNFSRKLSQYWRSGNFIQLTLFNFEVQNRNDSKFYHKISQYWRSGKSIQLYQFWGFPSDNIEDVILPRCDVSTSSIKTLKMEALWSLIKPIFINFLNECPILEWLNASRSKFIEVNLKSKPLRWWCHLHLYPQVHYD
jgi:hypothetical protein